MELKIRKCYEIKKDFGLRNTHRTFVISDITKNSVLIYYDTEDGLNYSWVSKGQFNTMFEPKKIEFQKFLKFWKKNINN
jgi:hypothetical protein